MLRRQVRLDKNNQPVLGIRDDPFTKTELLFLKRAMAHTMMKPGKFEILWNIYYLHELALQRKDGEEAEANQNSAECALRSAWKQYSCDESCRQLETLQFNQVDFVSFLLVVENFLIKPPENKETRDLFYDRIFGYLSYYRKKCETEPTYTTGTYIQCSDIRDCIERIKRLKPDVDSFIVDHCEHIFMFK